MANAALRADVPQVRPHLGACRPDLIAELVALGKRDGMGLTSRVFADKLGIDPALLSRAQRSATTGDRLGIVACAKIVTVYPELSDAAAHYLADAFGWPIVRALAVLGRAADAETVGTA